MKFAPNSAGRQNTATFATVKEHLVQHIQSKSGGQDVAESLAQMKLVNLENEKPKREWSTNSNEEQKAREQKDFDNEFDVRIKLHGERERDLRLGLNQAYAIIMSKYCTQGMVNRVEAHPEFQDKVKNDPIKLLEVIQTAMSNPVRPKDRLRASRVMTGKFDSVDG